MMASTLHGMENITLSFWYLTISQPYQDFRFLCCTHTPFIPKIEAVHFSETLVPTHQNEWYHIPENVLKQPKM